MTEKIFAQVNFEIGQIDHLLESYATLLETAQVVEPDLVETTAVASVLHSFYNVWNAAKSEVQAFLNDLSSNGEQNEVE